MGKLFGTDGIRGKVNLYPMTVEIAQRVGVAAAMYFRRSHKIVIGKDTRLSGDMIMSALMSGVCATGCDCLNAGMLPTPAVALLTQQLNADAGIVISASHNPFYDNGIKFFQRNGTKLSDSQEAEIEQIALQDDMFQQLNAMDIGRIYHLEDAQTSYVNFLTSVMPDKFTLQGIKLIVDCSNGAMSRVAPELLKQLGADVHVFFDQPDGININQDCGSEHTDTLSRYVIESGADIGLAFDGDGDRLIVVDELGQRLTGDHILAILALYMKQKRMLINDTVVSTVMSNKGLSVFLKQLGVKHRTADVGDRYVKEMMVKFGAVLGGEDSGHILLLDHHTTGDGLLTGLKLIQSMIELNQPLSQLNHKLTIFPQVLMNVDVSQKPPIETMNDIMAAIRQVEERLGENGRVLVRYSGTQPICRVMVEGPDLQEIQQDCLNIVEAVKQQI